MCVMCIILHNLDLAVGLAGLGDVYSCVLKWKWGYLHLRTLVAMQEMSQFTRFGSQKKFVNTGI